MANRNNNRNPPPHQLQQYVKPGLTLQQVIQAKSYFDQFADKQTELIQAVKIRQILEGYGQLARQNQLHYTFQAVLDTYGEQSMKCSINFEQFLYLVTSNVSDKDSRTDMKRLFNLYDDDRKGFLSVQKLRHIADQYGIWISEDQLNLMIQSANIGNDGKVTEEQFFELMTMQNPSK